MSNSAEKKFHQPDWLFVAGVIFLIVIGLTILTSASYSHACQRLNNCYFYLKHQIIFGIIPGFILFLILSFFDYHHLKKISFPLLMIGILLLIAIFIPKIGVTHNEASRWLKIGKITFQPSELIKFFYIIYLSAWLSKNKKNIASPKKILIPLFIILFFISLLIILEPDISTSVIIILIALTLLFVAGISLKYLFYSGISLGLIVLVLIKTAPYRLSRLRSFLHPTIDPQGINYHINQALIKIGSGGILGKGLGHSMGQIDWLPETATDSIFAVLAQEFGFIFTSLIICLFIWLTWRIFKIAKQSPDDFGKFLASGIGFLFILQASINIGTMLRLIPLTGIPLPLISYGGSNLIIFLASFGIVVNISRQI